MAHNILEDGRDIPAHFTLHIRPVGISAVCLVQQVTTHLDHVWMTGNVNSPGGSASRHVQNGHLPTNLFSICTGKLLASFVACQGLKIWTLYFHLICSTQVGSLPTADIFVHITWFNVIKVVTVMTNTVQTVHYR